MIVTVLRVPVWHHILRFFLLLANMHGDVAVLFFHQALRFLFKLFDSVVQEEDIVSKWWAGLQADVVFLVVDPERSVLGVAYSYKESQQ
jgi:hypothetical protein